MYDSIKIVMLKISIAGLNQIHKFFIWAILHFFSEYISRDEDTVR